MHRIVLPSALCIVLAAFCLPAMPQQLKIESQGQAEQESRKAAATARSMARAIGAPATGMGLVVIYRSSRSPGDAIALSADGLPAGNLGAGRYVALPASPGTHPYGPGSLTVAVKAGETKYLQVIRDRAGNPRLLASNATKFQAVARQAK